MHSARRLVERSGIDKADLAGSASLVVETETAYLGWANLEPRDQGVTGAGVCLSLSRGVFSFSPALEIFQTNGPPSVEGLRDTSRAMSKENVDRAKHLRR
jgi:hypothetical protein